MDCRVSIGFRFGAPSKTRSFTWRRVLAGSRRTLFASEVPKCFAAEMDHAIAKIDSTTSPKLPWGQEDSLSFAYHSLFILITARIRKGTNFSMEWGILTSNAKSQ